MSHGRTLDATLFATLTREEWRLHAERFGGRRFLLFPLFLALLVGGAAAGLSATGTERETIVAGLHALVFAFGIYSGTAGFVGSDMLEGVYGELSLVLSQTTLPLSRRRLLGVFLVTDALFYGVLFVLPMAVGVATAGAVLEGSTVVATASPGAILALVVAALGLWWSLFALFVAGMVVTVTGIAIRTRGVPARTIAGVAGIATIGLWWTESSRTIWAVWTGDGPIVVSGSQAATALLATGLVALSSVVGLAAVALYDPTYRKPARTATDRFAALERRISGSIPGLRPGSGLKPDSNANANANPNSNSSTPHSGLVTKTLLDLGRSSGGFWKPIVSAAVLLVLVAFLVDVVDEITGIAPAPGIFFGGVLGLSAFTTYNWLTQFDSVEEYLAYPVTVEAVFRAKRTAFVLVGAPTVAVPYLGAVLWFEASARDAAVGAVLLAGYSLYYYGLTVHLAGFDPNEFLFDAVRFAAFTLGVAVVLVPTLIVGFVVVPPSWPVALGLAASGIGFGIVGLVLSTRAGPRWERTYRT